MQVPKNQVLELCASRNCSIQILGMSVVIRLGILTLGICDYDCSFFWQKLSLMQGSMEGTTKGLPFEVWAGVALVCA